MVWTAEYKDRLNDMELEDFFGKIGLFNKSVKMLVIAN